jgi:hypothetical protein
LRANGAIEAFGNDDDGFVEVGVSGGYYGGREGESGVIVVLMTMN